MKTILLTVIMMLSINHVIAQNTHSWQTDLKTLSDTEWTDGFEFVKYLSTDVPELMGINNSIAGENLYLFLGGTLHEGGTHFWLTQKDGALYVATNEDYQMFPEGDKIQFDSSRKYLLFRDKTGSLHGVLKAISPNDNLRNIMIEDMLRFVLAGRYTDTNGNNFVFSSTKCQVEGFPYSNDNFTFAEEYDFPTLVIIFNEAAYHVCKTSEGLELIPVLLDEDSDMYLPSVGSKRIYMKKDLKKNERTYPILSQEIMTRTQLTRYAGYEFYGDDNNDQEKSIQKQLDALATMRNEIFAAHGYIFKNKKWEKYFSEQGWYNPQYADVNDKLTEVEKINIEHLKLLEKEITEQ